MKFSGIGDDARFRAELNEYTNPALVHIGVNVSVSRCGGHDA
jgi:hypothetical protein